MSKQQQYVVATADIPFGDPGRGVYAFRKGDKVPADLVKDNGWQDYTAGESTQSAQHAVAEVVGNEVKGN